MNVPVPYPTNIPEPTSDELRAKSLRDDAKLLSLLSEYVRDYDARAQIGAMPTSLDDVADDLRGRLPRDGSWAHHWDELRDRVADAVRRAERRAS